MNLQDEINEINERIEALNKDVKSLVDELEAVMENEFPQDGDEYWFIETLGEVLNDESWEGLSFEIDMLEIGNVFRTKEQAEFALEKLKVEAELRKFSRPFYWGGENWILSMGTNKDIFLVYEDDEMNQGAVYFEGEYKAVEAIEKVGKERIKKYIFGVEE